MQNRLIILILTFVLLKHTAFCYETSDQNAIVEKASKIKLIALDVDGVLTNGEIAYTSSGKEIKIFNVKDGLGLILAAQHGFITAIITGRESSMVKMRAKELKVQHIYQNAKDKLKILVELASQHNLELQEICFIGDDLPDLPGLKAIGLACCPADAVAEVKKTCGWVSAYDGGKGAVRELTDFLISVKAE